MLSGFTATAILALLFNQSGPTMAQSVSAGFLVIALGFLSPLHHLDRYFKEFHAKTQSLRKVAKDLST
jgi:hypothetical protein